MPLPRLPHLRIPTKLAASFGGVLLLVLGVGAASLVELRAVNGAAAELRTTWLPGLRALEDLKYITTRFRLSASRLVANAGTAAAGEIDATNRQRVAEVAAARRAAEAVLDDPEERRLFEAYARSWSAYEAIHAAIMEKARAGDAASAMQAFNTVAFAGFNQTIKDLDAVIAHEAAGATASSAAAERAYEQALWLVGGALALVTLAAFASALWIGRSVGAPLVRMTAAMRGIADGDLGRDVPGRGRADEIGAMAETVETFRRNALAVRGLEAAQVEAARGAEGEKRRALCAMADRFETEVLAIARDVADTAGRLQAGSQALSGAAGRTSEQATSVAATSQEASANVQAVASAAEELTASIGEIGGQVVSASATARDALGEAGTAEAHARDLAGSVGRIGEVVGLISAIAAQTNLLALNATIEAARAGEAGRGFAVVASEVKALAGQTAKATDDITAQITAVQAATDEVVRAIGAVGRRIGDVSAVSTAISAAVEEQSAAVAEIARNVAEAARGTEGVTAVIAGVSRTAGETDRVADQMTEASDDMARRADALGREIDAFLARVRAA